MSNKITPQMIGWGSYGGYEGPYFKGTIKYRLPENPIFSEKCLAILSSTEGKLNAINAYDACIISAGMIQYCERFNLVSILLGRVAEKCGLEAVTVPLADAMSRSNVTFKCDQWGRWRFHFLDSRGVVDTVAKKKELFLSGPGTKGSWTPEAREHAKVWAAGIASVWHSKEAQQVQIEHVKNNLMTYVLKESQEILFGDTLTVRPVGWIGAIRAIFISFAANNPKRAETQLKRFVEETELEKWSPEWCIGLTQRLTFGPKIRIYEHRYEAIRPHVEKLFDVDLPKTADALEEWRPPKVEVPEEVEVAEVDTGKIDEEWTDPHTATENNGDDHKNVNEPKGDKLPNEIEEIMPFRPTQPSLIGFLQWLFALMSAFFGGGRK